MTEKGINVSYCRLPKALMDRLDSLKGVYASTRNGLIVEAIRRGINLMEEEKNE